MEKNSICKFKRGRGRFQIKMEQQDAEQLLKEFPEIFKMNKAGGIDVDLKNLRNSISGNNSIQIGNIAIQGKSPLKQIKKISLDILKNKNVLNYLEVHKRDSYSGDMFS